MGMLKEKVVEANELFGSDIVSEVLMIVNIADPDGAYAHCEDMGMLEHAECISFLYFD